MKKYSLQTFLIIAAIAVFSCNLGAPDKIPTFSANILPTGARQIDPVKFSTPTLFVFWASWCGPCRHEAPAIVNLFQRKEKLEIIGVSLDQDSNAALAFVKEYQLPYENLIDDQGQTIQRLFKVRAIPTLVLSDMYGHVQFRGSHLNKKFEAILKDLNG